MQKHPFDDFGINLFNEQIMKERLPHPVYAKWKTAIRKEDALDRPTADAIAHAMKIWAMEKGATHYTHWFQPLAGNTAEKHESFIDLGEHTAISRFSGKALIKGEGDASSFPSGGLRATFEARGYTYWDCTSPAFIKDNVLCIPTIFVSYNGETLDKKTPLLKSIEAINTQATRIVNAFKDKDIKRVIPMVGLEQEYFLIDKKLYQQRTDLINTGRTLFGIVPPIGQDLAEHYFGSIPRRVKAFMKDVNEELWKLGIYAKTEHNEAAPCQFEIAPLFADANIAVDQNQIIMEVLKKTADQHDFACIFHEKPFKGVNGSGKHNNWSLVSDDGQNLLEPGDKPHENIRFLLFVCAVIKAVDEYPELLRMASSDINNDLRLGAHEAPPAILSICMGNELEEILFQLENSTKLTNNIETTPFSISNISYVPKDTSDRNRTSPFAFTGNKFEFRMLGSSLNAATTNIVLNTIVADALEEFATKLEPLKYIQDVREQSLKLCQRVIKEHKRILFSGDGYSDAWIEEAQRRGLVNIPSYIYSIDSLVEPKAIELFKRHQVFTQTECYARCDILYEQYFKKVMIESNTLMVTVQKTLLPALFKEIKFYTDAMNSLGFKHPSYQKKIDTLLDILNQVEQRTADLEKVIQQVNPKLSNKEKGIFAFENIVKARHQLSKAVNLIEKEISKENFPLPTYEDMFISIL